MASVSHVTVPTGAPIVAWGSTKAGSVTTVLFMNQDLTNYVYLGTQSTITPAGPGTVPIAPNGVFNGDASETWFVVGSVAGIQPLVVVPNGQAYFLGITQGLGNLVIPSVQSPNFQHLISGWQISKDGDAEFNDVLIRGAEISESTITVEGADGGSVQILNEYSPGDFAVILFNAAGMAHQSNPPSIFTQPVNAGETNEISVLEFTSGKETAVSGVATLALISEANDGSTAAAIELDIAGVIILAVTGTEIVASEPIVAVQPGTTETPESWHDITLDAGWTAVAGYDPPKYRLLPDGNLQLAGMASWGSTSTATQTLNSGNPLPEAYQPGVQKVFRSFGGVGGRGGVQINAAGVIEMLANSTYPAAYCEIDSVLAIVPGTPAPPEPPPSGVQPNGPSGDWTLVFDDEFDTASGYNEAESQPPSSLRWAQLIGYGINGTDCLGAAGCAYVLGGQLYMIVESATQGAYISSSPSDGAGADGYDLPVGGYVEAKLSMPGPNNTDPWNWGGYFASGQDWPDNGEIDIAEGNGSGIDVNYHYEDGGEQQSGPINPAGAWCNAFHTFGALRGTSTVEFWWDGTLVQTFDTDDAGGAMSILPCNGTGGGGPASYNNPIIFDYVRAWEPGGSGGGGTGLSYRAAPLTSTSEGAVTSFAVSKQTDTTAGDWILIYVFGVDGGTPACSGFAVSTPDNESIGTLLRRQADGTEGSSFDITGLGGAAVSAIIATVAGASSSIVVGTPNNAGGSYDSFGVSSITPAADGWVLAFAGNETGFGGAGYAITPPAGYTSQVTNGPAGANATIMLADNETATPGATGAKTFTSTSAAYWTGVQVALTPA